MQNSSFILDSVKRIALKGKFLNTEIKTLIRIGRIGMTRELFENTAKLSDV